VKQLQRIRMGPIKLGKLTRGKSRELTPEEIAALRKHCGELGAAKSKRTKSRTSKARGGGHGSRPKRS
jgi:hypothetical protein